MNGPQDQEWEKKRRFQRFALSYPVRYRLHDAPRDVDFITSQTKDISGGGISFYTKGSFPLGTILEFEVDVPSIDHSVRALGRVMRIEEVEADQLYDVGISFSQIDDKDQKDLVEYIGLLDIRKLMEMTIEYNASDLYLMAFHPPVFRIGGELRALKAAKIVPEDVKHLIYNMLSPR